jgi:ubiquinone/menaquinone biosynthesis C-methylase UbiE
VPGGSVRPADLPSTVAWPLPPPGRPRYAWMLGLGIRRWQLRRLLRRGVPYLRSPRVILDLGAGTAADAQELEGMLPTRERRRCVLLDAQRAMLTTTPERFALRSARPVPGERVVGDVTRLPFPDGRADVVLSIGLLCCVDASSVAQAAAESARVLAPGGILLLGVPRWRGASDEAVTRATGLLRRTGGRAGHAVFQKPL